MSIEVEGVWMRRIDDQMQVLVEIDRSWRLIMSEPVDSPCSRIVEPHGITAAPFDEVTS